MPEITATSTAATPTAAATAGEAPVHGGACEAITHVFTLLGKRWNGMIINTLLDGPARFSNLVRLVPGVSERVLSERLSELAEAGLVTRHVDGGPPINVTYQLTQRGEALRPALAELGRWGAEQLQSAR